MLNVENAEVDIGSYNRAMFTKYVQTPLASAMEDIQRKFPNVARRFLRCRKIDVVHEINARFELFECGLGSGSEPNMRSLPD
jgi:hypothetical protein